MRGGARPGAGRKKGVPNKVHKAERKKIAAEGLTPKDYMLSVMRDAAVPRGERMQAAKDVAPYCHPRLSATEHTGKDGGPIKVVDLSKLTDEQLLALEPVLGAIAESGGDAGAGAGGDTSTRH